MCVNYRTRSITGMLDEFRDPCMGQQPMSYRVLLLPLFVR